MKNLLQLIRQKGDSGEIVALREREIPVSFERGVLQKINKKDTYGLAVRIINNGRLGFATASSPQDHSVVQKAADICEFGDPVELNFPAEDITSVECFDDRLAELTEKELIAEARRVLDLMTAYDDSIPANVSAQIRENTMEIVNTTGLEESYKKTALIFSLSTLSPQGFFETAKSHASTRYFTVPERWVEELVLRHQQGQNRLNIPTGKMPVIFAPETFGTLIYRLLAGIDGSNLNAGISPLDGKLEQKLFCDSFNIHEDPHRPWGIWSCPFDDEGVPTSAKEIIKDGVLKSFLYDLRQATEAGTKSTGNGFKRGLFGGGISAQPAPAASNLIIPPGTQPLADIISDLAEGLLVESVMGAHTGNIPAGEFSLNVARGYYIKNGKIQGKAIDTMVAGNIYETLTKIENYSSETGLLSMFGPIGYGPHVLIPEVSVTGKSQ